ncbi:MAG: hypothetical protein AB3N20_20640 [Rhizobiaceae bacterium]
MRTTVAQIFLALLIASPALAQSSISLDDFDLGEGSPDSVVDECTGDDECSSLGNEEISLDDVVNLGIIDREEAFVQPAGTMSGTDKLSRAITLETIEIAFPEEDDESASSGGLSEEHLNAIRRALEKTGSENVKIGVVARIGAGDDTMEQARTIAGELAGQMDLPSDQVEAIGLEGEDTGAAIQIVIIPIK